MSRPSDFRDDGFEAPAVVNPRLGPTEWLRWAWRQLTSMRTALLLLLALAIAAVPGSLLPQESADPNGVIQWRQANPGLVKVVNVLQGFDVYTSAWFSAIYLLLFVSLVGCVVPRVLHHYRAVRAAPPRTPARFDRLPASRTEHFEGDFDLAVATAERLLRRSRYRVARYGLSVSGERGYLRETGNLLFHGALVGVLVSVFVGSGFTYTGQKVIATGQTFVNSELSYDSLSKGRFFTDASLAPYSIRLDKLAVTYEKKNPNALGEPIDYTATVTTKVPGEAAKRQTIKVNQPIDIGGTTVYLLGNGYAPEITVRNADGTIAFRDTVPFRPTGVGRGMASLGVVKAPDTGNRSRQIGLNGFLYPTPVQLTDGTFESIFPTVGTQTLLSLNAYVGELGLDSGQTQNVYVLDTGRMKKVAGAKTPNKAIELGIGQTQPLPDGLGSVTFDGVTRFAALDVHHDPSQGWVACFVALAVLGLITSLLVPRRRMWVRVTAERTGLRVEYAGLARGDDPGLARAVADLAADHRRVLEAEGGVRPRELAGV